MNKDKTFIIKNFIEPTTKSRLSILESFSFNFSFLLLDYIVLN